MVESKIEKKTAEDSLNAFVIQYRTILLSVLIILLAAAVAAGIVFNITARATQKNLEKIDTITYTLTKGAAELTGADLTARQDATLKSLLPYAKKGGITGTRANMLSADLLFQKQDYKGSRDAWLKAADLQKKAYTAPIAWFNAAVCSEALNDTDNAITYYEKAAGAEDFLLADHALFSLGRVRESKQDFAGAKAAYQKISDAHPSDTWAELGMSRIIALKAEGKIQ
jgi:tetratricopeptide (TPR) repeat protein